MENSIQKLNHKFEFGCIHFIKIFIQLENPVFVHPCAKPSALGLDRLAAISEGFVKGKICSKYCSMVILVIFVVFTWEQ